MRLVLDTGVLISALITRGTPPQQLYQAWYDGAFTLLTAEVQLQEFIRVAGYPKLKRYITPAEAAQMILGLRTCAEIVETLPEVTLSPDPDDNRIIAIALGGQADYLVSGDKRDILSLKTIGNLSLLSPRQMLETLA